ncbi:hypothetical protein NC651_012085 [Populus alba x Populus x berolinensis]|nr:hypothetical protein NC651_012085 [Populus alba x Populus x berolinensis]
MSSKESDMEALVGSKTHVEPKPAITESALLAILGKVLRCDLEPSYSEQEALGSAKLIIIRTTKLSTAIYL